MITILAIIGGLGLFALGYFLLQKKQDEKGKVVIVPISPINPEKPVVPETKPYTRDSKKYVFVEDGFVTINKTFLNYWMGGKQLKFIFKGASHTLYTDEGFTTLYNGEPLSEDFKLFTSIPKNSTFEVEYNFV